MLGAILIPGVVGNYNVEQALLQLLNPVTFQNYVNISCYKEQQDFSAGSRMDYKK